MRALTNTIIIVIVAVALGTSLFARKSNGWDTLLLDVYAYSVADSRSSEAIYVALDDSSIAEFGGWPWPRNIHAQLMDGLATASVIVYDIAFVGNSANPEYDAMLERAAKAADNLVLPLLAERNVETGELITIKPFGQLADYAMLGHVDMPVEDGARLRTVYLKAGNANAQFPILGYAADIVSATDARLLKGARPNHERRERSGIWTRDYANLLVPRVDMSTITQISARSILRGEVAPSVFKGRPVFVGIDTQTLTKKLTLSGFDARTYSDAQIQIQLYEAIQHNDLITPVSSLWAFLAAVTAAILSALLLYGYGSRLRILVLGGALALLLIVAPLLAAAMGVWVSQGYGLLATMLLLVLYFVRRVDVFHRRVIPVNGYSSSYWYTRWAVQVNAAVSQRQAIAVCVIELDYFDRFKLDYSGGHITNSYYRIRAGLQTKLGGRCELLAFEHYQENRWVALLSSANVDSAARLIEQLPAVVEDMKINHQSSTAASVVTVSIGAAVIANDSTRDLVWLLGNADVALMQAIAQGRNHCVVIQ